MTAFRSAKPMRLIPAGCVFILTVVFFHPVLFGARTFLAFDTLFEYLPWASFVDPGYRSANPLITDPVNIFFPYYHLLKKNFSYGTLCFWNEANLGGLLVSPPANPLVLLTYYLLPLTVAHDLLLGIHLFLTGLFTCLYLTRIGLGRGAALIGAVSWMFNGYVMVWFEFDHIIMLAGSLAASLYCVECWLEKRSAAHMTGFAGALAYSISTNYAHILIYQFIFLGAYILLRVLTGPTKSLLRSFLQRRHLWVTVVVLACALLTAGSFLLGHLSLLGDQQQRQASSIIPWPSSSRGSICRPPLGYFIFSDLPWPCCPPSAQTS